MMQKWNRLMILQLKKNQLCNYDGHSHSTSRQASHLSHLQDTDDRNRPYLITSRRHINPVFYSNLTPSRAWTHVLLFRRHLPGERWRMVTFAKVLVVAQMAGRYHCSHPQKGEKQQRGKSFIQKYHRIRRRDHQSHRIISHIHCTPIPSWPVPNDLQLLRQHVRRQMFDSR